MGNYDHHSSPALTPPRTRCLRLISLVLLLTFASYSSLPASSDLLENALDWVRWKTTRLPSDPLARAYALLKWSPVIDTHIDLPILVRGFYANQVNEVDLDQRMKGQVDVPRLREGRVGGFFWSVYVPCPEDAGYPKDNEGNFTESTWRVRDTLEQIDVARLLIEKHSDTFELTPTANSWRKAMRKGKIGGMLGVEGGHQLGNTLSTLRTYFDLGARYVTLTHTCNNALADSCGMQGTPIQERWGGLSPFGRTAVKEMNRLGMMLDISHTSPSTASDALTHSLSPPIFSHSNARGVHPAVRNIPDSILRRIGATSSSLRRSSPRLDGEGGRGWGNDTAEAEKEVPSGDALISLNYSPAFVSEWDDGSGTRATIALLADHADYIGKLAGREHVGIGSDLDGIASTPVGLEDASKYPMLIAELIRRGWSDSEVMGVAGGNLLRIVDKTEAVARKLRHALPETEVFEGRTDLFRRDHF